MCRGDLYGDAVFTLSSAGTLVPPSKLFFPQALLQRGARVVVAQALQLWMVCESWVVAGRGGREMTKEPLVDWKPSGWKKGGSFFRVFQG